MYSDREILAMSGVASLDTCFLNPDTYQAGDSEILVPRVVPLTDVQGMLFCDQDAFDFWSVRINRALAMADTDPDLPPRIPVETNAARGLWGFRFPGNWRATRRRRP